MLSKITVLKYLLPLLLFLSCQQEQVIQLKSTYTGFYAETKWTFSFFTNNDYQLEFDGHAGDGIRKGRYFICDSTIVLLNDTEHFEDFELKRLAIIDNNCLRDFSNCYYCDTEENQTISFEKTFNETLAIIDTLENHIRFKKAKTQAIKNDSLLKLHLSSEGIKIINKEEAFEYVLKSWLPEYRRYQIHERIYIKPNPIRFYDRKGGRLVHINNE